MSSGHGRIVVAWLAFLLAILASRAALAQQGAGVLTGVISDAAGKAALPDAIVTVTSPSLQGEEVVIADATGFYRIPNLPPGVYAMRIERDGYNPFARDAIELRADATLRINAELLPQTLRADEVVTVARPPTVDIGSSSTGLDLSSEFTQRVPIVVPGAKGSDTRSFESVAVAAPGAHADDYGVSLSGSTSNENRYVVDGLTVNNPGFGVLGTPLSSEFVRETNVITAGYMPEYGPATGGILNVVTKSGSNEFHGSAFAYYSPGALEGWRKPVHREGQTLTYTPSLSYVGDVGADVGGPIVKDKIWFYAGFDVAQTQYDVLRTISRTTLDASGNPAGFEAIPGADASNVADARTIQAIGKLTWAIDGDNRVTLTTDVAPVRSGGPGKFSIDPRSGSPEVGTDTVPGTAESIAHQRTADAYDATLRWSTEQLNKHILVDTTVGWHHEYDAWLPSDGSVPGSGQGLADVWNVLWQRNQPGPHSLTDFETFPNSQLCTPPPGARVTTLCPVTQFTTGGPGDQRQQTFDRYQASSVVTYIFSAAGHHVLKGGVNVEYTVFDHIKSTSGGTQVQESSDGTEFQDLTQFGYIVGPDKVVFRDPLHVTTKSVIAGGFLQDSWEVLDQVTVNVGVRYDAQFLYGGDGQLGLALPNEWSPRLGVIYDVTHTGRSKIYANYARYYEAVPLDMADIPLTGEPSVVDSHDAATCDPRSVAQQKNQCRLPGNYLPVNPTENGDPSNPNRKFASFGIGATPIDPNISPTSSDEFVGGGEYELFPGGRLGGSYTRRWMNRWIDDMSRDNGQTYFLGNPGYGIAGDFPKAERTYDAFTAYLTKGFRDDWLAQVSYTVSYLRGNVNGLFRPGTGLIEVNHSADFDTKLIEINRNGPLPGDHNHDLKIFGAKDWRITPQHGVTAGLAFHARSGAPTTYLGAYPDYAPGEAFILPAGSGPRLPWEYSVDAQIGYRFAFDKDKAISFSIDVYNLFDFQAATAIDQIYTTSNVYGVTTGRLTDLRHADGTPLTPSEYNPNFGNPTAYQSPRIWRFGLRGTF